MQKFRRILVPVDLSDNCLPAISLASGLAIANEATIIFCYVALPPLEKSARHGQSDMDELIRREHGEFHSIKPDDLSIEYEHHFLRGNPGPEILKTASEKRCDLIVLSTHGRTGFSRWLMGSVAEYVVRNARCPVLTVKQPVVQGRSSPDDESLGDEESEREQSKGSSPYVTSAMQHVSPIHDYDRIDRVIAELHSARCTAAPVIDEDGHCIGILTQTDINVYEDIMRRWRQKDKSVIPEMFETDKFGMVRTSDQTFFRVEKHMTSPVIQVSNRGSCQEARKLFAEHPDIHHLIVVDDVGRPLGVVEPDRLEAMESWDMNQPLCTQK